MTPDQLTDAACNLAHGLGIPVYTRDGRIHQQGPGVAFLPPSGARSTVADVPSLEEEEVFAHHTAIEPEGFRALAKGQRVEFDVTTGPKGLQACNVRPVE
jgi:CspA family cold shock protein